MGFSRQEYWSGLPFSSPGDIPDPGIEPRSPHCRQILYHLSHQLLGSLNDRYLFSHSLGGWKSEIRVPAQSGSGESPLYDLQTATFSLCIHTVFPWCMCVDKRSSDISSPSYKDTDFIMGSQLSRPHLNLITSQRSHPWYHHIAGYGFNI